MIKNRTFKVFLCHSKSDKLVVRRLYKRLRAEGFEAWFDEEVLIPGQDWDFEIRKAVRDADAVVVCLSKDSITKEGYVQKEISLALDIADEKPEGTIFLIPVRLEDCEVPTRIRRYQWIDLFSRNSYQRLLESLNRRRRDLNIRLQSDEILGVNSIDYRKIAVLGAISTDGPIPTPKTRDLVISSDFIEIASDLFPKREKASHLFALQAVGDGLKDAMINDGDIIVLKPADKVKNGEMVAVWLPDRNESTLRYFYNEIDGYRLQPANPTHKPIMIKKTEAIEFKGKVIMVIRKVGE
jgi:SOS-response transcriptional repressor LexA